MGSKNQINFVLSPDAGALGLKVVSFVIKNLNNKDSNKTFDTYKTKHLTKLKGTYNAETVAKDPILIGYRQLHEKVGRSNRQFTCSSETLVKSFLRRGEIPSINLVVDIYNLVSLETRLSIGAHDVCKLYGDVVLRLGKGDETFVPLGKSEPESILQGEYCYMDSPDRVICRLDCRQADETKVTAQSNECLYVVEGNEHTSCDQLDNAARHLIDLTKRYCGGTERVIYPCNNDKWAG